MTIFANTGRVGINTTAPSQLFHVYTNTDMYAAAIGNDAASHLRIAGTAGGSSGYSLLQTFTNASTAGGNLILQRDAGNVGIGIASPSAQLHATGTIRSGGAGVGYSMLYPGTTSNAGYVQVHAPDGSEVGYMGWLKDRLFHYSNHNFHEFNGSVRVGGINSTYVWPGQIGLRGSNPFISWHNADAAGTRIGYMQITGTGSDAGNVIIGSGSLRATCLAGSGSRVLVADGLGTITAVPYSIVGDNLGNHTATSYLFMDYQWIRFRGSTGLYNSDFGQHFFTTNNSNYWVSRSGLGMQFLNASAATMGYVYHDGTNFGLLPSDGGWAVRTNPSGVYIHKTLDLQGAVPMTGATSVTTVGANAAYFFADRTVGGRTFAWYATGDIVRLWSNNAGDRVTYNNATGLMSVAGSLTITGVFNSTGYKETSDARWKKNVSNIPNALSKVMAMRGVNYDFKTKEELLADKQDTTYQFSNKRQIGFIAQEVEKVLPEVVSTDPVGYKTVEYSKVVALLVEAMKEQQKEIEALKAENASLKAQSEKVQKLEAKMAKLEEMMNALQDMSNAQVKK